MNYTDIIKESVCEHLDEKGISGILLKMLDDDDLNILCGEIKHVVDRLAYNYKREEDVDMIDIDDLEDADMDDDEESAYDIDIIGLELACIDLGKEIAEVFYEKTTSLKYMVSYMKEAFETKCNLNVSSKHLKEIISTSIESYNDSCTPHKKRFSEEFGDLHGWYWKDCNSYECSCFEHIANIKPLLKEYIMEENY